MGSVDRSNLSITPVLYDSSKDCVGPGSRPTGLGRKSPVEVVPSATPLNSKSIMPRGDVSPKLVSHSGGYMVGKAETKSASNTRAGKSVNRNTRRADRLSLPGVSD